MTTELCPVNHLLALFCSFHVWKRHSIDWSPSKEFCHLEIPGKWTWTANVCLTRPKVEYFLLNCKMRCSHITEFWKKTRLSTQRSWVAEGTRWKSSLRMGCLGFHKSHLVNSKQRRRGQNERHLPCICLICHLFTRTNLWGQRQKKAQGTNRCTPPTSEGRIKMWNEKQGFIFPLSIRLS